MSGQEESLRRMLKAIKKLELAGCVILNETGAVLLIHRSVGRVQWELPGGKREPGETLEQTACRELQEELGIGVTILRQLGDTLFGEQDAMHYTWFLAEIQSGIPKLQEKKYDDLRFFRWQELAERVDLSENTKNLVGAFLDRQLGL